MILTDFTIALLEDSGWYKGNYTALDELNQLPLEWGKGTYVCRRFDSSLCAIKLCMHSGLGCSFLNHRCINKTIYPYLCDESTEQDVCTYDHLSKVSN